MGGSDEDSFSGLCWAARSVRALTGGSNEDRFGEGEDSFGRRQDS